MTPVGIMQGRLSPPLDGRIQSFPVETWRQEFHLARQAGLACIEWIFEEMSEAANPLGNNDGTTEICRIAEATGVAVRSVCADYYMTQRLVRSDGTLHLPALNHLRWLLGRAGRLGVRYMVLPFVDASSLATARELEGLLSLLHQMVPTLESASLEIHLETDLPPAGLQAILNSVAHPLIRANYDIGNSAALGRDPEDELTHLGPWLDSVHVKDRVRGGGTVPLGTGSADLPTCFRMIAATAFRGPFILQAARGPENREVELAIQNRELVEGLIAASRLA